MTELNRREGHRFARNCSRLLVACVLTGALTACGGDESPADGSALTAASTASGSTTLSWMPPTRNDDGTPLTLTGYRIYWGHSEGNYSHSVTVNNPGLSRYVVEQLTPATYFFVATALSSDGESPPSNVVTLRIL
jgi:hypothetical protein